MSYYRKLLLYSVVLLAFYAGSAYAQQIPSGREISLQDILDISKNIGGFLLILGGILAGITIIVSGITYFSAGSNPQRVKTAKDIFKAGIIGSFILFGSGLIINTIKTFATDPLKFFESSTNSGSSTSPAYYCVNGSCIQSIGAPSNATSGPYSTYTCNGGC